MNQIKELGTKLLFHNTMDHFTVHLVSNASVNVYPDNTLASFRNQLPDNGLFLDGEWEVALSEITFPSLYKNVTKKSFFQFIHRKGDNPLVNMLWVPPGRYHSVQEVTDMAYLRYKEYFTGAPDNPPWTHTFDKHSGRMALELDNEWSHLNFAKTEIGHMFGYKNLHILGKGPHVGDFPVDLEVFHTMFVNTNIVEHQIVGDAKNPLLRTIPLLSQVSELPGGHKELVFDHTHIVRNFDMLEFRPVHLHNIDRIDLELRNETGELMPFMDFGRVSATLVFKKMK